MRCRQCGRVVDDNSRFCTYCDCDNYPQMNQVKTKGSGNSYSSSSNSAQNRYTSARPVSSVYKKQYTQQNQSYTANSRNTNKPKQSPMGCVTVIIIIAILFFIFSMTITSDLG